MKATDDQLTTSDWDTLFTKDPYQFFETVLINILHDDTGRRDEVIARQARVFEKWLNIYNLTYRDIIAKNADTKYLLQQSHLIAEARRGGQIDALSALPVKKTLVGKIVDLDAVAAMLRDLKALAPPAGVRENKPVQKEAPIS